MWRFLAPGPRRQYVVVLSTEKRPSSRPLLLPNRPLSAVYMPYLLSYCARAAVAPRSCRCWPSLALACAALVSCAMGRGEWLCCCCICCIAALYLLLLLLLLLLPCSPSCCLCCGCCRCCLAYFVLLLWLLPLMCPTPYVSFERKEQCVQKHKLLFHLLSFKQKALHRKS